MDIVTAIKETLKKGQNHAIIRTSWETPECVCHFLINIPDEIYVMSPKEKGFSKEWIPTVDDLTADDWQVKDLIGYGICFE